MSIHTWAQRFATDTGSPATPVFTTRNFQKLGRNLDIIQTIFQNLHTALPRVEFSPGVTIELILFASMASL
jgi:hypothetical protein